MGREKEVTTHKLMCTCGKPLEERRIYDLTMNEYIIESRNGYLYVATGRTAEVALDSLMQDWRSVMPVKISSARSKQGAFGSFRKVTRRVRKPQPEYEWVIS